MAKSKRSTQLPTQQATRGTRSNVLVPEDDSSDMEDFFNQAKSPAADDDANDDGPRRSPRSMSKTSAKREGPARTPKERVRLSLPGQQQDGDVVNFATRNKRRQAADNMIPSPSELSRVSTLPPTPGSDLRVDEVEVARLPVAAEEDLDQPVEEESPDPHVPEEEDESDGDDLAPPVMDDDDVIEEPSAVEPIDSDDGHDANVDARSSLQDTDSEDGDKSGPGFAMTGDDDEGEAETPVEQEKKQKKRVSIAIDEKTPPFKKKGKKNQRGRIFSPKGIPIGSREYQRIPIVEPSPTDAGELRRSRRSKQKPLEFWRNERVEYGPADDDDFFEEIGDMPLPKAIMRAQDTPYRKRKATGKSAATLPKQKKAQRSVPNESTDDHDDAIFDYSKLKKKYKDNLKEDEIANVWDDGVDELSDLKVVAYAENMEAADLPLSGTRTREEGNVVGKAAQAFNIPSDPNDNYVGYIMGNLYLPPRGIKDAESVGPCSQTFTVCTGQKKAIEVAFADPDGPEGILDDGSAQRFMLGPGDLFRVPPGNTYRLQNHSKTMPCLLTWTIIRPRILQPAT